MKQPQDFEREWWGDCGNTFGEETKQLVYARLMGLERTHDGTNSPFSFDVGGKKILDIGGGPSSLILKTRNRGACKVVDPCPYPQWVTIRYAECGIEYSRTRGEDVNEKEFDEVWIYNVLQHVENPELIIKNALRAGKVLRLFEWIGVPAHEGHPHELTEEKLNEWIGGIGVTGVLNGEGECFGNFYSITKTQ